MGVRVKWNLETKRKIGSVFERSLSVLGSLSVLDRLALLGCRMKLFDFCSKQFSFHRGIGKETRMYPNKMKVSRMWVLPAIALGALLALSAVLTFSNAQAATVAGEFCIEGVVINWKEEPLADWVVTLYGIDELGDQVELATTTSAPAPEGKDDDPKGFFEFDDVDLVGGLYSNYLVTVAPPNGQEGWEGVTPTELLVPLRSGRHDCARIRFKVRRVVVVEVYKIDSLHQLQGEGDWEIKAEPGPGNNFAEAQTARINDQGFATFTLTLGVWTFMERPVDNKPDSWMPILPHGGKHEIDLTYQADPYQIVFKNDIINLGCVVIMKYAVFEGENGVEPTALFDKGSEVGALENVSPFGINASQLFTFGAGGWGFKLLRSDGSIAASGKTDAVGRLKFENLPFGPYTIVEDDMPGWAELSDRYVEFTLARFPDPNGLDLLDEDGCYVFEFFNEQDGSGYCVEGRKVDVNGFYGIADWEIEVNPVAKGGFEFVDDTNTVDVDESQFFTNALGEYRIDFPRDDYRVPGGTFEICEEDRDGWVSVGPSCYTVTLPEWPGRCVQVPDFKNAQVGHKQEVKHGKDGPGKGGPITCSSHHEVKKGEGLFSVGASYKVTPQAMLNANPEVRATKDYAIYIGQRLCIP